MPRSPSTRREFFHSTAALAAVATLPYWFAGHNAKAADDKPKLKIYILWDMEGTSGLFKRAQTWFWEKGVSEEDAEEGRKLINADVNSATAAALKAGADRVIVCDTHHGGGNIRLKDLLVDPRVSYHVRSTEIVDGARRFMPELDETVAGLMLMAHHGKAGTEHAFLPHTNNLDWADYFINGQSAGEIGMEACYAGHWNVPLLLVQGEEAACTEAEIQFPGVVTARVKRAVSHDLCTGPDAQAARQLTAEKVAEAIQKLQLAKPAPYKPSLPLRIAVRMKTEGAAQKAANRQGVRRLDAYTVAWELPTQREIIK
jgi:D-amino peptidase